MSAANPIVSVIIGVYNGEKYLEQALDSVLGQTFQSYEIILIDDGSEDSTAKIASNTPNVNYSYQENAGHAAALNAGIELASGSLLAFLDADDIWLADKLERQVGFMNDNPEYLYSKTTLKYFLDENCALPNGYPANSLDHDLPVSVPSVLMCTRKAFEVVGRFDSNFGVAFDTQWFAKSRDLQVSTSTLASSLTLKRIHKGNSSSDISEVKSLLLRVLKDSIKRKKYSN